MKANEAPEKIYVHEVSAHELTEKLPYHIEYVHKDAFIEKACEWVKENLLNHTYVYEGEVGVGMAVFLEEFRKYMEE